MTLNSCKDVSRCNQPTDASRRCSGHDLLRGYCKGRYSNECFHATGPALGRVGDIAKGATAMSFSYYQRNKIYSLLVFS